MRPAHAAPVRAEREEPRARSGGAHDATSLNALLRGSGGHAPAGSSGLFRRQAPPGAAVLARHEDDGGAIPSKGLRLLDEELTLSPELKEEAEAAAAALQEAGEAPPAAAAGEAPAATGEAAPGAPAAAPAPAPASAQASATPQPAAEGQPAADGATSEPAAPAPVVYDLPLPKAKSELSETLKEGARFGDDADVAAYAKLVAEARARLDAGPAAEKAAAGQRAASVLDPSAPPTLMPADKATLVRKPPGPDDPALAPFLARAVKAARAARAAKARGGAQAEMRKAALAALKGEEPAAGGEQQQGADQQPAAQLSKGQEAEVNRIAKQALTIVLRGRIKAATAPAQPAPTIADDVAKAKTAPPPAAAVEEKLAELDKHFWATQQAANLRAYGVRGRKHGWMVGQRELFQRDKESKKPDWPSTAGVPFKAEIQSLKASTKKGTKEEREAASKALKEAKGKRDEAKVEIPERIRKPGGYPKVLAYVAEFLAAIAYPDFTCNTRLDDHTHGHGFGIDCYLTTTEVNRKTQAEKKVEIRGKALDERGFWPQDKAIAFLKAVDAAATAKKLNWTALYNDYGVIKAFPGKVGYRGDGDNWHGPILQHIHLEVVPAEGSPAK